MFYRGSAIGVVVEHQPRQGHNALLAIGFERIAASAEIRQCLGLPRPDGLPCVSEHVTAQAAPAGVVPVSEADLRLLGVLAAISVPGVPDEVPPEYVPRDVDTTEFGVRARVAAAAERGGFVLLVGGSSVGKTRCAAEAVKTLLPDWWLVQPAGSAEVAALAAAPPPRTVVWLDELQSYLDGEQGLTGGVVRALLNAPHPAVIIGTLWPDRYAAYTAMPAPGGADPYAREREVLDLAEVIRIGPEFSAAEQDRARAAAARDPRLKVALGAAGYGLTQTLAAAPQLVARWEDAQTASPYAWAVLTAALDVARLGARAPLGADFLRAAAPGYCTSQQQAEAPGNWFDQAVAYATGKLYGAAAALRPAGEGMGQVAGYTARTTWCITPAGNAATTACPPAPGRPSRPYPRCRRRRPTRCQRRRRLLYGYAIRLYRHAADSGDREAAPSLAELLDRRGDHDEAVQVLQAAADVGDSNAARLLARRGLRARAERGDEPAANLVVEAQAKPKPGNPPGFAEPSSNLGGFAAKPIDIGGMIARFHADSTYVASRLAMELANRGDLEGLRAQADAADWFDPGGWLAAYYLAQLLAQRGDLDGLCARIDAGDRWAGEYLPGLLTKQGRGEEAERLCRFGLSPDGSIADT